MGAARLARSSPEAWPWALDGLAGCERVPEGVPLPCGPIGCKNDSVGVPLPWVLGLAIPPDPLEGRVRPLRLGLPAKALSASSGRGSGGSASMMAWDWAARALSTRLRSGMDLQ